MSQGPSIILNPDINHQECEWNVCAHLRCGGLSWVRIKDLGRFCMKPAPVKGHLGWGRGRPPPGKLVQTLARKKVRTVVKWQDKNLSYPRGPEIPTEKANLCHQKHELTSIGEDVERREHLWAVVGTSAGADAMKNRMGWP